MAQLPVRLSIGSSHALQLGEAKAYPFAQWRTNPLPLVRKSAQTPRQYLQRAELRAVPLLAEMSQGRRRASGAVRHRGLSLPITLACGCRGNARCLRDRLCINPESESARPGRT